MNYKIKARSGFTLIELLVVISIIALLVSILMPALGRARKQARNVVCMANIKSWSSCIMMYLSDHDDAYWYDGPDLRSGTEQRQGFWMGVLEDYYGENDEFRLCPTASNLTFNADEAAQNWKYGSTFEAWIADGHDRFNPNERRNYGSYGTNLWLSPTYDALRPGWGKGYPLNKEYHWGKAKAKNANNIPIIGDCAWYGVEPWDIASAPDLEGNIPPGEDWVKTFKPYSGGSFKYYMWRICLDRHDGGVNWSFMDGSMRKVLLPELWALDWNKKYTKDYSVEIDWLN